MPCLLVLFGLMVPRLVLFVMAIFTDWIAMAYGKPGSGWAFLGFLFMPYTTLAYIAAMLQNNHQVSGGWFLLMIVAVIFDLGGSGSAASNKRR